MRDHRRTNVLRSPGLLQWGGDWSGCGSTLMHAVSFPCPHCAIPLRVREREFVGRTVVCPECDRSVTIAENRQGGLTGVAAGEPQRVDRGRWPSPTRRITPVLAGWFVAGCLLLGLTAFLLRPVAESSVGAVERATMTGEEAVEVPDPPAAMADAPASIGEQLARLHELVLPGLDSGDAFPSGTVGADGLPAAGRFSWIAALSAARDPDGPQPQWDRAWNDPANERFVRRRQPTWLNPAIETVAGEQGYPATHFVGVAGVGPDAATLPIEHPRAGIFGDDRRVRVDDVSDGLANTMLVAGVEERLGSWAAGGEATIRGFTAEPYVDGPDGFGTGEADGMHVLMADGSVRFLSRNVAPAIVRRMAAMNDGLPLDPDLPGEPRSINGEAVEVTTVDDVAVADDSREVATALPMDAAQVIADLASPQELPIDVLLAEPLPVYDAEAALMQPIVEFQQKEPVPIRDLLRLVEEMAAVPIREAELPPDALVALDEEITLSLSEATVGDILAAILRSVELTFDARPEGVFLQRKKPPAK